MSYKIIVINLKNRTDRKENVINIFKNINFEQYCFYEAINGKELNLNIEIKNLFKNNDFNSRKGFIGCALSHYNIWIDLIKDIDNSYYVIFEDDFILSSNFIEVFSKIKEMILKNINNIDFLFLGYHTYDKSNINIDNIDNNTIYNINKLNLEKYVGGFFSYFITKDGATKMLNYIEKNNIKHGIDYLIKINDELKIFEVNPNIVFSDWVKNLKDDVDSNIQRDFDTFNMNTIYDYYNYLFIKNVDHGNDDLLFLNSKNIDELFEESNKNEDCCCFNTLGFLKSKININELKTSPYFTSENDGIFIKLNRKINVKLLCDWTSSENLCNKLNSMSKGNYKWNNIKITHLDDNIDYYVIINKPKENDFYIEDKTFIFKMDKWFNEDLDIKSNKEYYNVCTWNFKKTFNDLNDENIQKTFNHFATLSYSKCFDAEYIKKNNFLKFIEEKNDQSIKIDIYDNDNEYNFDSNIISYKYYLINKNNSEYNYFNQKIWEPIINECLCFYWDKPYISDYIDSSSYVLLNLDNFEESYNIIKNAIENDLYSQRIDIIKKEKYKILNYYNFFPRIERLINKKLFKSNEDLFKNKIKIYFMVSSINNINYKLIPLIYTLEEFGFNIELFEYIKNENIIIENIKENNIEKRLNYKNDIKYINLLKIHTNKISNIYSLIKLYEKIHYDNKKQTNYLILDENTNLLESYQSLFNHLIFLPDDYDICNISNNKSMFKITDQINPFYYKIRKYYFKNSMNHIISKNGIFKLLSYVNNYLKHNIDDLFYNCYEDINDFNFYINKNNLFS